MKFLYLFLTVFMLQQSISLPSRMPIHCTSSPCQIVVWPNTTQILVAKESGFGAITDSLGGTWVRDGCTPYDNGECIFHANINAAYPIGDTLTFPSGGYTDVEVLQYDGTWNFVAFQCGTYAGQCGTLGSENDVFPDCRGVGDCPYDWTLPVEVDAGNLLVAYSFPQASGPGIPKPGLGWSIEANDGFLAIEDMIAPTEGVYIGSLIWKSPDGASDSGSHWLMGIGIYAKVQ